MTVVEKHIRHFNLMNGNKVRKDTLQKFYDKVQGIGGLTVLKSKLKKAIKLIGNDESAWIKFKPLKPSASSKLNGVDNSMLYGLQNIQNDAHLNSKGLNGLNDTTYKVITDRILELIKDNGLIWQKPWNENASGPSHLAQNYVTKHTYRGANFYLNYLQQFKLPYFFTFDQVTKSGGKVKKGEKGWPLIYFKWLYKDIAKNKLVPEVVAVANGKVKSGYAKIPGLFYYNVFNYDQTEGLKVRALSAKQKSKKEIIESAERIIEQMPIRPELTSGPAAWYSPSKDVVQMPHLAQFKVDQHYYSVYFHELVHSTGHPKRVGRDLTGRQASKSYAFEELIAELGASFLCGESGILYFTMKNSAAYIKSWSNKLREEMQADPKFFLRAAAQAQKAADFMLARGEHEKLKKKGAKVPAKKKSKGPVIAARPPVKRSKVTKAPAVTIKTNQYLDGGIGKNYYYIVDEAGRIFHHYDNKWRLKKLIHINKYWYKEREAAEKALIKITTPSRKPEPALAGFTTADQAPDQPKGLFRLPGVMGELLGDLQRYKLVIVIAGETHSGKSEIGKQIADAFISQGDEVAWIDWEQGGLASRDTMNSIRRNVRPENHKKFFVNSEVAKKLDAVKGLASKFRVIALDSGSSLKQVTNEWIDELREQYPQDVWIILMQQNVKGGTRGGSSAEFDTPVVIKTYRPDENDFNQNYAYVFKNRGNKTGLYYNIAGKAIIPNPDKES